MIKIRGRPRFAILCRVSTRGQLDGVSLDVQEQRGRDYVKRARGIVTVVYRGDESGLKSLDDRESLRRMLADAASGKFDALYTLDRSRLARNPETMMALWAAFKARGVDWHTDAGKTDIDTPEGRLVSGVMAFVEEYGATKPRSRTSQSRQKMLAKGEHAFGRWPFGRRWNKQKKAWEVDNSKKRQIERAYRLYVHEGKSFAATAKLVGMPKSSLATRFRSAAIANWERKLTTPEGEKVYMLSIPPLLTRQQAAAVERRSEINRTVLPSAHRKRWLLQGMLRCWHCGRSLTGTPSRKSDGSLYPVYRHQPASRTKECLWHVPADLIEKQIVATCGEVINSNKKLTTAIRSSLMIGNTDKTDAEAELAESENAIRRGQRKLDRVVNELIEHEQSGPSRDSLRRRMKLLDAHLKELETQRRDATSRANAFTVPARSAKDVATRLRALCGLGGVGPRISMTPQQQRLLVSLVVGRTKRDSKEGIFVRMFRFGKKNDVYWTWELRGSMAVADGTATDFVEFDKGTIIDSIKLADHATATRLAQLALEARPLRYKPSRLYSSSGSPRCA